MPPELVVVAQNRPLSHPPLLTLAVPTYNRARCLKDLLKVLEPQLAALPEVELLVSDNASPDTTPAVLSCAAERLRAAGAQFTIQRHAENIGADGNFASCYRQARGQFFWICGDDDLLVPGALEEVVELLRGTPDLDMIYATSYGFHKDYLAERQGDPFGRTIHTFRDALDFARVVNIMFTFISGVVVNRQHLESIPHEAPDAFLGTNLVQLSWSLPLLLQHRRSVALWTRPVAARVGQAHGYSLGRVFGENLASNVQRLLPGRPDLQAAILNVALRRWFPSILLDFRAAGNTSLALEEAHAELRRVFGGNPRYWLFTWPALRWPLGVARPYTRLTAAVSKAIYMLHFPGFWRKRT